MNAELSIVHLIAHASVLVQIIMGLLVLASVVSWAVIFSKRQLLSRTRSASEKFEERFWSGGNLADLYESVARTKDGEGIVPIFSAGFEEYKRQQQHGAQIDSDDAIAAVQRQMRVTQVREIEKLEGGLALLATIGSTSPYVGLFGTVWGIMNAFIGIGNMKQASLAVVAPGIAEALIATAMGLFAAIPAVIAFNFFTRSVESLETQYHTFSEEMIGIIERGLRSGKA
jgi:biopolymer transport protein TolQ